MSHEEKQNILSLFTLVLISIPYLAYILIRHSNETFASAQAELSFWATAVLIIIPIRIVAEIIGYILMSVISMIVTGKEEKDMRDERDNKIGLWAIRNSYIVFSISMLAAFILIAIYPSISLMFVVLMIGGTLAEFAEIGSKIVAYRFTS